MKKPIGYWSFENCKKAALKCDTRNEFKNNYRGAYASSTKHNWLEDVCSHMVKKKYIFYIYL